MVLFVVRHALLLSLQPGTPTSCQTSQSTAHECSSRSSRLSSSGASKDWPTSAPPLAAHLRRGLAAHLRRGLTHICAATGRTSAPGLAPIGAGTGPHRRRDCIPPGHRGPAALTADARLGWPMAGERGGNTQGHTGRVPEVSTPPARPAPPQSECSDHLARSARRAARRGRATGQRRRRLCVCLRSCKSSRRPADVHSGMSERGSERTSQQQRAKQAL